MIKPRKPMQGERERERYWNEDYVRYWKARVDEANTSSADTSGMVKGDARTSTDRQYENAIASLQIDSADKVLELGCGFGRSLPMLCNAAFHVAAVDISKEMIATAKKSCGEKKNISFHVSPSENLPFADGSFDIVVCFAAFDAMYQSEALAEMNRVGRLGARVLITGKNDEYFDDDAAALAAEVGARAKGHPNYFTDVNALVKSLRKFGFSIELQRYYLRRGDFAREIAQSRRPAMFYEYLLVLKKMGACSASKNLAISNDRSKTYIRANTEK